MVAPRKILWTVAMVSLSLASTAIGAEIVYIDNPAAVLSGTWVTSNSTTGYYGTNYAHNKSVAGPTATYTPTLSTAGEWSVWTRWTAGTNRASSVPYTINYDGGSATVNVNQQINGSAWRKLGDFTFAAGTGGNVFLNTAGTTGYVIADAVAFARDIALRPALSSAGFQASASSTISTDNRLPIRAVDGSGMDIVIEPVHLGTANGRDVNWLSGANDTTGWFKVDLGSSHELESMDVYNFSSTDSVNNTRGVKTFDLYVSNVAAPSSNDFANSAEWTLVEAGITLGKAPVGTNNRPDLVSFGDAGLTVRWVALDITSNHGDAYTGLGELRFYPVPEPTAPALAALVATLGLTRRKRRTHRGASSLVDES
jgi:hypothetical protein